MVIEKNFIEGLVCITPKAFEDKRGYFMESYNQKLFEEKTGIKTIFCQDNESKSTKNILRGLHFQKPPFEQAKLVRAVKGKILDVAVDLRKNSQTFGKHYKIILSSDNKKQIFIPKGFAHGFKVLSNSAIVCYKTDQFYNSKYDSGIKFNSKLLNIDWLDDKNIISEKDKNLLEFDPKKLYF